MSTTTLVVGATGATGHHVVAQLLARDQKVRVIARSKERMLATLPEAQKDSANLQVFEGSILDISDKDLQAQVSDCDAVVSCLGHNMTFKGLFAPPRYLCTDTMKRFAKAIEKSDSDTPTKLILMSSNGVGNPNKKDNKRPFGERMILSILRNCLPPHRDNEHAAAFLHKLGTNNPKIEWAAVRPDDLINGDVSEYETFEVPQLGLFGAGQTTRSNVAHFMVDLILKQDLFNKWKFKMPVLENVQNKTN